MYIEAIVVCVNYGDFLAYTLPQTKQIFNYTVVVTTPEDKLTQQICSYHNVECLKTNAFYEDGASFNKAKGINEALLYISKRDWIVHIDADIYLPPLTQKILYNLPLDKNKIYGIDRLMCPDYTSWIKYVEKPQPIHENYMFVNLNRFPIANRVADYNGAGYAPIGYFQLWHGLTSRILLYPETHDGADRTDMHFSKKWSREKRELIPEIIGIHLDSENATVDNMGKNWNGRKTSVFGNTDYPEKKTKFSKLKEILKGRKTKLTLSFAGGIGSTFIATNYEKVAEAFLKLFGNF